MNLRFLAPLLGLTFALQTHASCLDIIHRLQVRQSVTKSLLSESEDAFMRRLDRIERTGNWLRQLKKDKKPAIHARMNKRLVKLDGYLFTSDYATAHRELRTMFREVEFSALAVKSLDKQLESVRALSTRSIAQAQAILKEEAIPTRHWLDQALEKATSLDQVVDELTYTRGKYEVKLGSGFQEYLLAREHLEGMLGDGACSGDCQKNIQRLLDSLGAKYPSDRTRFASFLEAGQDLSSDGIRELIDQHRLATTARLKRERNAELFSVFREFATQPAIVQKILFSLTSIPGMHKLHIVRVFKSFLDGIAQAKHVPAINEIVRSQADIATKLDKILKYNGDFKGNEFLINFSRRNDLETKRVWNEAVTEAGQRSETLSKELLNADKMGKARGPLDILSSRTPLPRWLVVAGAGGGIGYFWFGKTEVESVDLSDIEPAHGQIPMEEDVDQDLDAAAQELQQPEVQEVILDSVARAPGSISQPSLWHGFMQWLGSVFDAT